MVGVGVAVGPISGGWLLEHFSWGSIFLVNVPIAAVAIIGGLLFIPTSRDPATPPIDYAGLVLSTVGVDRAGLHHHRGAEPRLDQRPDHRRASPLPPS